MNETAELQARYLCEIAAEMDELHERHLQEVGHYEQRSTPPAHSDMTYERELDHREDLHWERAEREFERTHR